MISTVTAITKFAEYLASELTGAAITPSRTLLIVNEGIAVYGVVTGTTLSQSRIGPAKFILEVTDASGTVSVDMTGQTWDILDKMYG